MSDCDFYTYRILKETKANINKNNRKRGMRNRGSNRFTSVNKQIGNQTKTKTKLNNIICNKNKLLKNVGIQHLSPHLITKED